MIWQPLGGQGSARMSRQKEYQTYIEKYIHASICHQKRGGDFPWKTFFERLFFLGGGLFQLRKFQDTSRWSSPTSVAVLTRVTSLMWAFLADRRLRGKTKCHGWPCGGNKHKWEETHGDEPFKKTKHHWRITVNNYLNSAWQNWNSLRLWKKIWMDQWNCQKTSDGLGTWVLTRNGLSILTIPMSCMSCTQMFKWTQLRVWNLETHALITSMITTTESPLTMSFPPCWPHLCWSSRPCAFECGTSWWDDCGLTHVVVVWDWEPCN